MANCKYENKDANYVCPFDAEEGKDYCIFHLPVKEKELEKFWKHLANFLWICLPIDTAEMSRIEREHFWIVDERNSNLKEYYRDKVDIYDSKLIGFIFPSMDDKYNFRKFKFLKMNFLAAQFSGKADFRLSTFRKSAYFSRVKFEGQADFTETVFNDETYFVRAEFVKDTFFNEVRFNKEVLFSQAQFTGHGEFRGARFMQNANFIRVNFYASAFFGGVVFSSVSIFSGAKFSIEADFGACRFSGFADFNDAQFDGSVGFHSVQFDQDTDFSFARFHKGAEFLWAKFLRRVYFCNAQFSGNINFRIAEFYENIDFSDASFVGDVEFGQTQCFGIMLFARVQIDALLNFTNSVVYNQLLFEGTNIKNRGQILLWNINFGNKNFVQGIRKFEMVDGKTEHKITTTAGTIVFKDIREGMNRVSFLHTEIYYDRPYVKFFNVYWHKDPKNFLFDAQFVTSPCKDWISTIAEEKLKPLVWIFNIPANYYKISWNELTDVQCNKLVELVRLDVERISREIRRFYEDFGNYPDAGDYYIAEMEYRRVRTPVKPRRNLFYRIALELYKCISNYGESPGKALYWLLGIWFISSVVYLFTGFSLAGCNVRYLLKFDFSHPFEIIGNFLTKAIWFSFINLIPGYFRFTNQSNLSIPLTTTIISIVEGVLGITVLTLFLLAVRRRFRR